MSVNTESSSYEPLIQQTRSSKIRKQAIVTIASVALIAVGFAQIFGQSDSEGFLGAKNQMSLVGVSQQISIPGQNFIDVFVDKDLILGLTYKFSKKNAIAYYARAYNPYDKTWVDYKMEGIITNSKVNAQGKRVMFSDNEECYIHYPDGNSNSISGVQDAALDNNGTIFAIATQDLSNDQYRRFGSVAKFYSNKLYRNVEVYQEKPVLVKQNGNLEDFNQLCVQQISAGQNNGGGLFALSCEQQKDSLYQVMRWNQGLKSWENIDDTFAEKIATFSNDVVYIFRQSSIFELTIKK
ncbi:UNKNOWN [Stylonychia lemnae]|uniref:Transmembrane protein n=1 Tax=Stylonychia lemnae TaxID=5949 RepID=A0A078AI21_STYLE|nr:UNKNOWN [Stylonychia lemnae]|eukprot:CDW81586.1 UNKNOWN [Stylonychia lemnae]